MWNMDEKGFILGTANRAKDHCTRGSAASEDNTRWNTRPHYCDRSMRRKTGNASTIGVFKETALYKGWYSEAMDEKPAHFADSSNLLHNG